MVQGRVHFHNHISSQVLYEDVYALQRNYAHFFGNTGKINIVEYFIVSSCISIINQVYAISLEQTKFHTLQSSIVHASISI